MTIVLSYDYSTIYSVAYATYFLRSFHPSTCKTAPIFGCWEPVVFWRTRSKPPPPPSNADHRLIANELYCLCLLPNFQIDYTILHHVTLASYPLPVVAGIAFYSCMYIAAIWLAICSNIQSFEYIFNRVQCIQFFF